MLILFANLNGRLFSQWADSIGSWGYQLQQLDIREAAESPFDLLVVDAQPPEGPNPSELRRIKSRPGEQDRLVFAYLSIGEAESYRPYWKAKWRNNPPDWLRDENPDWPGNYKVHFWHFEWQEIILQEALTAQENGFDGLYLDLVDAYEFFEPEIRDADERMVRWIAVIRNTLGPNFKLIVQNAEDLVAHPDYINLIDGIAKEELFFTSDGHPTKEEERNYNLALLKTARGEDKLVLTVDYIQDPNKVEEAYRLSLKNNFVPLAADLQLDRLPIKDNPFARRTPAQFYAVTLPDEVWRGRLGIGLESESPSYDRGSRTFQSPQSFSQLIEAGLSRGIGKHWEAGMTLPIVRNLFWPDSTDQFYKDRIPRNYIGPGNLRIVVQNGYNWNDYRNNLLFTLESELPTDQRDLFQPGLYHRLSAEGEQLSKKTAINFGLALNLFTDVTYRNWYYLPEASLGIGYNWRNRWFGQVTISADPEALKSELFVEWLIQRKLSVDFNFGKQFLGVGKGIYAHLGLGILLIPKY